MENKKFPIKGQRKTKNQTGQDKKFSPLGHIKTMNKPIKMASEQA